MNESTFTIESYSQYIIADTNHIKGELDDLQSYLNFTVQFQYKKPQNTLCFDMLSFTATLKYNNYNAVLSEVNVQLADSVYNDELISWTTIKFPLNIPALNYIEKNRTGDIIFTISFQFLYLLRQDQLAPFNFYVKKATGQLQITIPRSRWIESILPGLGFRNLRLIEIPIKHDILEEVYADIISEFLKAEEYFNMQDYDKCVAHFRNTLDHLTRNLKKIRDNIETESGFKWLKSIDTITLTWIDGLNKASSALTSKSHHAGQKLSFSKVEAESIYLVCLGLLHYIGNISKK